MNQLIHKELAVIAAGKKGPAPDITLRNKEHKSGARSRHTLTSVPPSLTHASETSSASSTASSSSAASHAGTMAHQRGETRRGNSGDGSAESAFVGTRGVSEQDLQSNTGTQREVDEEAAAAGISTHLLLPDDVGAPHIGDRSGVLVGVRRKRVGSGGSEKLVPGGGSVGKELWDTDTHPSDNRWTRGIRSHKIDKHQWSNQLFHG